MGSLPARSNNDPIRLISKPNFTGLRREQAIGQLLMKTTDLREAQLNEARNVHRRTGAKTGEALLALGYVRGDHLASALAYKHELPLFDEQNMTMDETLQRTPFAAWCRDHRLVPLAIQGDAILVGTTDPLNSSLFQAAQAEAGQPILPVVMTNRDIERLLHSANRVADLRFSTDDLKERVPADSAHRVLTTPQAVFALALLAVFGLGLVVNWAMALIVTNCILASLYFLSSLYKLYLVHEGWFENRAITTSLNGNGNGHASLNDRDLPIYTILVPLYRETAVIPQLKDAITALDWPKTKLDVRLLLEEDDTETITAARKAKFPAYETFIMVPKGGPRAKPKACNYGLIHARGEYVVIYDAEDIPEPDQLKRVYPVLRDADSGLACIQCRLNFYNANQNLLTRWFTAEYYQWFDLTISGLFRTQVPIPLGGTSNHFRREVLERLGAWDPYNVTEDADLGVRLYKLGLRTEILASTTYEEANPAVGNWIRQRSRWVKGFTQTWLVHMRHPVQLWRTLGPRGFLGFQFIIGGTVLSLLLNPLYWGLVVAWFATQWEFIRMLHPTVIYVPAFLAFVFGNYVFVHLGLMGAVYSGNHGLVKYTLLMPIYWVLMSIAAWKGVLQLVSRPHHWEKTEHGLAIVPQSDPITAAEEMIA